MAEQATEPTPEPTQPEGPVPFLLMLDCTADPDDHEGMLPLARVLEEISQALAPVKGVEVRLAHVSIREHRDEMLNAFEALNDEEVRRG